MGIYAADERVTGLLLGFSQVLMGELTRSLGDRADGITWARYRALVVLASHGPRPVGDLASWLGIPPLAAQRMCHRLERGRLIARQPARPDGLDVLVSITAAGRGVVDLVASRWRRFAAGVLAQLSPAGQRATENALRMLTASAGGASEGLMPGGLG